MKISNQNNRSVLICHLTHSIKQASCFLSYDSGSTWNKETMYPINDKDYGCQISPERSPSEILFFFKIIDYDNQQIIETNNGVFYKLELSENDTSETKTTNSDLHLALDLKNKLGSADNKTIQLSSSTNRTKNPATKPSFQDGLPLISSKNPFSSENADFIANNNKKIIKFISPSSASNKGENSKKHSNRGPKPLEHSKKCPHCQGVLPSFLSMCPYCGSPISK